jgi:putative nucleotidyltransferase-like protein
VATSTTPSFETALALSTLLQDRLTAGLVRDLEGAGVPTIVLKGPAIANWLYPGRGVRTYGDSDLLVSPDNWGRAMEALQSLGFEDDLGSLAHPRMESLTSHPWKRPGHHVDLHCTLWGIETTPERAWQVLSSHTTTMSVGGEEVRVLALGARTMHVALHAAQHGYDEGKPISDLELAVEVLPEELWLEAAEVAAELDAVGNLATGLRLVPEGRELAERLGITPQGSVDALLRVAHVPLASGFEELATTRGVRGKLSIVRSELVPTPDFMRWWSPLARRGPAGLAASYLWRPLYLATRAVPGLLAWRRARRLAR